MNYFTYLMDFMQEYDYVFMPIISCALLLFCVFNFCKNVYRKQNKKIKAVTRKICAYPHKTALYANSLPPEYRRQWRAYVNCNADMPSLAFEFAPVKYRVRLLRLIIVAAIINSVYLIPFVMDTSRYEYLIMQIAFWVAFTLVIVTDKLIFSSNERKAKRIFARFLNELNRAIPYGQVKEDNIDKTVKQLNELQKCEPTNAVFDRASQLLRDKGLNSDRTVEQQRKLNGALNGLLQSYTKTTV